MSALTRNRYWVKNMAISSDVKVEIEKLQNTDLKIKFNSKSMEDIIIKRSGILKNQKGAEARQLMAASLGECMCSTLIFLLEWVRIDLETFNATIHVHTGKDEDNRRCVTGINLIINLQTQLDQENVKKIKRVKKLFEKGCLISRSLSRGINITYSINSQ